MPKKPKLDSSDPFFGVRHRADVVPSFQLSEKQKLTLRDIDFEDRHLSRVEAIAANYRLEFGIQNGHPEARKKARKEIATGVKLVDRVLPSVEPVAAWYERISVFTHYAIELEIDADFSAVSEIPTLLAELRLALAGASVKVKKLEKGKDEATRAVIWKLAEIWEEATGKPPTRRHNPHVDPPADYGPFHDLVSWITHKTRPSKSGIDTLIREILTARKNDMAE